MARTIKASEVKPGMEVQFNMDGWHVEGTVSRVEPGTFGLDFYSTQGFEMTLGEDTQVTVLSEPQPEEPTAGGARVVVDGRRFLRAENDSLPWVELDVWGWHTWDYLCDMGTVTVIPDQGWAVPADGEPTPEVPDRIEEWPEDDEHLRAYRWVGSDECEWRYVGNGEWRFVTRLGNWSYLHPCPCDGPWDRVTDA